jgi:hypothetical protein
MAASLMAFYWLENLLLKMLINSLSWLENSIRKMRKDLQLLLGKRNHLNDSIAFILCS